MGNCLWQLLKPRMPITSSVRACNKPWNMPIFSKFLSLFLPVAVAFWNTISLPVLKEKSNRKIFRPKRSYGKDIKLAKVLTRRKLNLSLNPTTSTSSQKRNPDITSELQSTKPLRLSQKGRNAFCSLWQPVQEKPLRLSKLFGNCSRQATSNVCSIWRIAIFSSIKPCNRTSHPLKRL